MEILAGSEISIGKAIIRVIGPALFGHALSYIRNQAPGTFSVRNHHIVGVFAGLAINNLQGTKLSSPAPVLLYCNQHPNLIQVRSNSITGAWLGNYKFSKIKTIHRNITICDAA